MQDERSDGQSPTDGTVPGDVEEVIKPEQEGSDGDGNRRQYPVTVARRDNDEGQHQRGHQLNDSGGIHGSFDAFGFGASGPSAGPSGDADAVNQNRYNDDDRNARQYRPAHAADDQAAADQPEGCEG